MRSSLKELDGSLFNKDDFINKQNGKLAEKDRQIQSQKADMERLEKKTKMQEYKVRGQTIGNVPSDNGLLLCGLSHETSCMDTNATDA